MKGLLIAGALVLAIMFSGCGTNCVEHNKETIKMYRVGLSDFEKEADAIEYLELLIKEKSFTAPRMTIQVVCKKCLKE